MDLGPKTARYLSVPLYFWWCRVSTHMHRVCQAKSTLFCTLTLNTPSHDGYVIPSLYIFNRQKRQVKCVHCNKNDSLVVCNSIFLFISFPCSQVLCSSKLLHIWIVYNEIYHVIRSESGINSPQLWVFHVCSRDPRLSQFSFEIVGTFV